MFQSKVMLYNMDTTCWPHASHMIIQGRVHSSQHRLSVRVYKVDYFVKSSLLSSLVLSNTRLSLNPTLRVLSYNIQTLAFLFKFSFLFILFYLFGSRVRVRVILQSHCHKLVTSHKVTEKSIEGSEKIISYNVYYTS